MHIAIICVLLCCFTCLVTNIFAYSRAFMGDIMYQAFTQHVQGPILIAVTISGYIMMHLISTIQCCGKVLVYLASYISYRVSFACKLKVLCHLMAQFHIRYIYIWNTCIKLFVKWTQIQNIQPFQFIPMQNKKITVEKWRMILTQDGLDLSCRTLAYTGSNFSHSVGLQPLLLKVPIRDEYLRKKNTNTA